MRHQVNFSSLPLTFSITSQQILLLIPLFSHVTLVTKNQKYLYSGWIDTPPPLWGVTVRAIHTLECIARV